MDPNLQPNLGNVPLTNVPAANSDSGSKKGRLLLYVFFLLLVIAVALGGYFSGATFGSKTNNLPTQDTAGPTLSPGFVKAQELTKSGGVLINSSELQIRYRGNLIAVDSGKSWTLSKDGETTTLTHQLNTPVRYFVDKDPSLPSQSIGSEGLKVGDDITVLVAIDLVTAESRVSSIVVHQVPGSEATTSAAPAGTTP